MSRQPASTVCGKSDAYVSAREITLVALTMSRLENLGDARTAVRLTSRIDNTSKRIVKVPGWFEVVKALDICRVGRGNVREVLDGLFVVVEVERRGGYRVLSTCLVLKVSLYQAQDETYARIFYPLIYSLITLFPPLRFRLTVCGSCKWHIESPCSHSQSSSILTL